jgi:DNA repair ATPase RecN
MNTESKQKYLDKINEYIEMNELKYIVDIIFDVNITNKVRKRDYVEARMVFAKILRDRGATLISIGSYLNKNHSTVLNYMANFDNYFSDASLKKKYAVCRESFFQKYPADRLYLEKDRISTIENKYKRFKNILDIMNDRTPYGKEDVLEKKIISFLNGI